MLDIAESNQNLSDRLNRADSWLHAASRLEDGSQPGEFHGQTAFIYRYIAFNSLYGRWKYEGSEKTTWTQLDQFFDRILTLDSEARRHKNGPLRGALIQCQSYWLQLIENEFLDNGYWAVEEHRRGFKEKYRTAKYKALERLSRLDHRNLLHTIFSRIVVLRNQVFHGCATFGRSSLGWRSIETANPVLRALVPTFHSLMTQHPEFVIWPPIPYPRRGSEQHPKRLDD